MSGYYVLRDRAPVLVDFLEWAKWIEDSDRRVALTTLERGGEKIDVSTVYLGIDHRFCGNGPPLLFETMTFGGPDDGGRCARCSTWEQAESQHARVVTALMADGWHDEKKAS